METTLPQEAVAAAPAQATILVVDDDLGAQAVLRLALAARGHRVLTASSGDEALAALGAHPPDLVLLDVRLPGPDGFEVARRVRLRPELTAVPVIFVTALAGLDERLRGFALGADDYVTRPFTTAELLARVDAALRRRWQITGLRGQVEELERLSLTDELTGLKNRRYLLARVAEELARGARWGQPLACVMADVDHFKRVNDGLGHPAGDTVLRWVADRLRATVRASDVVARYGGEEFCLLLPETDGEGAARLAEKCRAAIAADPVSLGPRRVPVRISAGHAWLSPAEAGAATPEELIRRADVALLAAKRGGRDRVVAYGAQDVG